MLRPLEAVVYKLAGVNESTEQRWTQYTASLLAFSIFSFLFVYLLQRLQGVLPLNPQGFGAGLVSPDLAFNTAISFVTNTNWQAYSGESTLSYLVQMAALTVQNFASAAAGIAVAIAAHAGLCTAESEQPRKFLGGFDAGYYLRSPPFIARLRSVPLLTRRDSKFPSLYRGAHHRGRETGDRARSCCFAGSN